MDWVIGIGIILGVALAATAAASFIGKRGGGTFSGWDGRGPGKGGGGSGDIEI